MKKTKSITKRIFGPGTIIAAAFIGPGTVTTCSLAGLNYGYSLLWALLFSICATIVLQEMSSRLGLIGQRGLGSALREKYASGIKKIFITVLVISALGIGCAAYESGNISGAALGVRALTGLPIPILSLIIGVVAFSLLWIGKYRVIEKFLVCLVVLMGLTFVVTAVIIKPDIAGIMKGLVPRFDKETAYIAIGLIGTTVVPYNIFLHASIVRNRWKDPENLSDCRIDLMSSILLGGFISAAIVVTSATAFFGTGTEFTNAAEMGVQLQPLLGNWSNWFFALGFFSAGVSSALTAPLAASLALSELFGWDTDLRSNRVRLLWMTVLFTGILFSSVGLKPIPLILFAQVMNGLLLSIVAVILIIVVNDADFLKDKKNSVIQNIMGLLIVIVAVFLGVVNILKVFKVL